ncbi:hypothetical protein [Altererythrobacter sp. Root672]|uniref:hypothetical protein n=1 Tax=Altererythrobacter sp. Root672 TaxID=1736584 RepID=UPI0006F6223B|nr:hypothetical protein [Altererythrobacter sp. Root672]KRA84196.1 hypothetical protein ASD76_09455 [Altererythrobacter sp. Root672]
MSPRFRHFTAIDWSGAAGERQRGIAVASCSVGDKAPKLVRPGHTWSRLEVLQWLTDDLPDDTLVGLDLGISLPFTDCGAFFPGWEESPRTARDLWALIDHLCGGDPHLGATSFVDDPVASRYFRRHGGREGPHFHHSAATHRRGRFRLTEEAQERMGCKPYSNFNLVGAAQVGKSSLTGMRLLHRLDRRLPVWPIDPLPPTGSAVVEIYTAIAALAAGRRAGASKIRDRASLDLALAALGSQPWRQRVPLDDHKADALITAAWIRSNAERPELWSPETLTPQIAQTEGWTFGVA